MAQYVYDIEGQPLNTNPLGNGWVERVGVVPDSPQAFGTSVIETIANPVGTKAWRTTGGAFSSRARLAVWTAGPTDAATVEVLSLQRRDSTAAGMGNLQRFTTSGSIDGYFLGLRNNATDIRGRQWNDGDIFHTDGNMGSAAHGLASSALNVWVWQRSRSEGNTHRVRAWLDGSIEPTTWMLDETRSPYPSGATGFGDYTTNAITTTVAWFSVGTNGDPAPDSPLDLFRFRHHPRLHKVIPTLSSPTVTDIGATCVRPRVTKGF